MRRTYSLGLTLSCNLLALLLDHDRFQIHDVERLDTGRVAMIAMRSAGWINVEHQYFVVLGAHVFSPNELRKAYGEKRVALLVPSDCLATRWESERSLQISCRDRTITSDNIAVQRHYVGDVRVTYDGIPDKLE